MISLKIHRLSLISGVLRAEGLTVVIDVFRAFTTAAYVMHNGAATIIPVETVEDAFKMKKEHPDWLLMGEVDGVKVEGFDYGNSPYEMKELDFKGKTLIQRTSAGTQGIVLAQKADELILGSFVNADAIVEYILRSNPDIVSLVAMGWGGKEIALEDEYLSEYLEMKLQGRTPDFRKMKEKIRESQHGEKFFDPDKPQFVEGDFHAAMDLNRFNFVLRIRRENGLRVEFVSES